MDAKLIKQKVHSIKYSLVELIEDQVKETEFGLFASKDFNYGRTVFIINKSNQLVEIYFDDENRPYDGTFFDKNEPQDLDYLDIDLLANIFMNSEKINNLTRKDTNKMEAEWYAVNAAVGEDKILNWIEAGKLSNDNQNYTPNKKLAL